MEQDLKAKWEGKASTRLDKAAVEQIWPLFVDYFNIHKYFSALEICNGVHGNNGEPGCIRYVRTSSLVASNNVDGDKAANAAVKWANEKLIAIDHDHHTLTFDISENNFGYKSYIAMMKIYQPDDHDRPRCCAVEWSFSVDPVPGWTLDAMVAQIDKSLQDIARNMEGEVLANLEQDC